MNRIIVLTAAVLVGIVGMRSFAEEKSSSAADDKALQKELERCAKLPIDELAKDAACDAAAQANARRFIGNGPAPYTPVPVNPFPSAPQPKLPAPKSN